jgi:DNA-binding transcriptional LysR family regulator
MDELKPFAVFAETVSAGSMSAAARRLGMTPSAVSQIIRALEQQAGVALLHRSTRKLSLTEAGERSYPRCL